MRPNPTIIHVGMPKTATTTLQTLLFNHHSQLYYLGKFGRRGMPASVMPALLRRQRQSAPFKAEGMLASSLEEQLAHADRLGLRVVLSKEGLSNGSMVAKYRQAALFRKTFGECKIVFFIREQLSFVKSFYAEMLKSYQFRTHRKEWMRRFPPAPHYFDINDYLEVALRPRMVLMQYLSVNDTANIYARVFGRQNVHIYLYEAFCRQPRETIAALCKDVGIEPAEALELVGRKQLNQRVTSGFIERLREIESSAELTSSFRTCNPGQRRQMLPPALPGEKIATRLSTRSAGRLQKLAARQNRKLLRQWDLPLKDHGYQV